MNMNLRELRLKPIIVAVLPIIILFLLISLWGVVEFLGAISGTAGGDNVSLLQTVVSRIVPFLVGLCILSIIPAILAGLYFSRRQKQEAWTVYDERSGKGDNSIVPEEVKGW